MYKRLKFVLFSIAITLIFILAVARVTESKSTTDIQYVTYIVQPGQTLWDIAKELHPGEDPRRLIFQIREVNDITPIIQPGQAIKVPISD